MPPPPGPPCPQLCNKQYNTAMEIENHLSSYDHHHKKVRGATDACIT
jgi:hypothetical protein